MVWALAAAARPAASRIEAAVFIVSPSNGMTAAVLRGACGARGGGRPTGLVRGSLSPAAHRMAERRENVKRFHARNPPNGPALAQFHTPPAPPLGLLATACGGLGHIQGLADGSHEGGEVPHRRHSPRLLAVGPGRIAVP